MGAVPIELAADVARSLKLAAAVETGTFLAESTLALAEVFPRVYSIEVAADLHRRAVDLYGDRSGITFLHGSSVDVLPEVTEKLEGPAFFWLDGHWCEGAPEVEGTQCPVLSEIDVIDASTHGAGSVILIDDAHMHVAAPPPPYRREDWPPLVEVIDALRRVHRRYVTILEDVIVAGPREMAPVVDAYWLRLRYRNLHAERDELRTSLLREQRPRPLMAARRFAVSLLPDSVRHAFRARQARRRAGNP